MSKKFCHNCNKPTLITKVKEPRWSIHVLLALFTGFWLLVILYLAIKQSNQKPECTECGTEY